MKVCCRCKDAKPLSEFYNNRHAPDGKHWACKACNKLTAKVSEVSRVPSVRTRQKQWRKLNMPKVAVVARRSYRKHHEVRLGEIRNWHQRYPERVAAHQMVYKAVKQGTLVRPDNCEVCGQPYKVHGHHSDYSKPLDVLWVCRSCHMTIHAELEAQR